MLIFNRDCLFFNTLFGVGNTEQYRVLISLCDLHKQSENYFKIIDKSAVQKLTRSLWEIL